jgi:adenosine/AMP kinase
MKQEGVPVELKVVKFKKREDLNIILGQSHFIKTVEDIHEVLVTSVPGIKFGIAFCEASGDKLVRASGTDDELIDLARENALAIGAGHTFNIILKDIFPINVLDRIKRVPEVVGIFAATANPLEVIVAETAQGRGIVGVIDGESPVGAESEEDVKIRQDFLRKIGYKF